MGLGWVSLTRSINPAVVLITIGSALFTLLFGLLQSNVVTVLLVAIILGIFVNTTQIGIYTIFPSLFPARVRAGATGLAIGIGRFGAVVGPMLAGVMLTAGWNLSTIVALIALPYVLAAILISKLRQHQNH